MNPPPLFAALRASTDVVVAIARDFSPRLERHGPGAVVCDVSGLSRLLGEPDAIGRELADAAAAQGQDGATRVALAPTRTAALLLSLAHAGLTVVEDDVATALAGLPLDHLEQLTATAQGVTLLGGTATKSGQEAARQRCARAFDMARRWGVSTMGALGALPADELSARMGQVGVRLQRLAQGHDAGPFVPDPDVPRFIERMELEWPIDTLEPLSFVFARLLEPLSVALERADRGAAAVRLDVRLIDRTVHARVLALPVAMRDARVLRTLLMLDLESHPPPAAIDVVTIEMDPAPGRVIQYSLLERAVPSDETLATLTARLGALVGDARCGSPVLLDTCRTDGFEMRRFELLGSRTGGPVPQRPIEAGSGKREAGTGKREAAPEHHHFAPTTGQAVAPALRRFRPPVAVRVTVQRGRPVQVAIDRRGMPGGAVEQCAGPWRTSGGWWDPASTHWDRDEWDVLLRDGVLCRLFREQGSGTWFVEGVLD